MAKSDIFDKANQVKSNFFKPVTVGDSVEGVYVKKEVRPNTLKPGTMQTIYSILRDDGVVVLFSGRQLPKGGTLSVSSGMENCRFGQKVAVRFDEEKDTGGPQKAKICNVYSKGEMDMEALEAYNATNSVFATKVNTEEEPF